MERINKNLVSMLAYEERLGIYRIAQNGDIEPNEVFGALLKTAQLSNVVALSDSFDFTSISALGLENCCNFFKALCDQYVTLKDDSFGGEYSSSQQRFAVDIGSKYSSFKTRTIDIGLYDAAQKIDEVVKRNFALLKNGSMSGNSDETVYRYAQFATFADTYYNLRDCIEGKSYYDSSFMRSYRELPKEYEKASHNLLLEAAVEKDFSVSDTKQRMLKILDSGIDTLQRLYDVDKFKQGSLVSDSSDLGSMFKATSDGVQNSNSPLNK